MSQLTTAQLVLPDKTLVRSSFDRVAAHYDEAAVLQREVGNRLWERLDEVHLAPTQILDVGAGTGAGTLALAQRYPQALVVAVDIAPTMLHQAQRRWLVEPRGGRGFVCADAESLPFTAACTDLIYSNLTLQWCSDLTQTFTEFHRVLRSAGLLTFTTFGPDTLYELRRAWQAVDHHQHVNTFIDMHNIGDALSQAGFGGIVMDMEYLTLTYPDVMGLMRDLKALGAHNVIYGRHRGLTGRERWQRLIAAYETMRRDDLIPATYEVIYGHAWSMVPKVSRPPTDVNISLEQLRRERHALN